MSGWVVFWAAGALFVILNVGWGYGYSKPVPPLGSRLAAAFVGMVFLYGFLNLIGLEG